MSPSTADLVARLRSVTHINETWREAAAARLEELERRNVNLRESADIRGRAAEKAENEADELRRLLSLAEEVIGRYLAQDRHRSTEEGRRHLTETNLYRTGAAVLTQLVAAREPAAGCRIRPPRFHFSSPRLPRRSRSGRHRLRGGQVPDIAQSDCRAGSAGTHYSQAVPGHWGA